MDEVKLFCSKDCPDTCSFSGRLDKNGKLLIKPLKDGFLDRGFVCKKLKGFYKREVKNNKAQSFYAKDGDIIVGENALEKLANFLIKNKDKKILLYRGSGSLGYYMGFWDKFFSNFENCYFVKGNPCDETGIIAHREDFGVCTNPPVENLKNAETIILFGKNAYTASPHLFVYLQKLKKLGKKIIYIDPIKSETAKIADRYIRINPASDGLLAYALLAEMGYFPKKYELFEKIGISKNDFEYIINSIKLEKTGIIEGAGMQRYSNSKNAIQWVNRLAYFTDNINNLFYSRSSKEGLEKIEINKKHIINIAEIANYLKRDFFDIIVVVASNPVITMPENSIWKKALEKAKTVVIDTNETNTSRFADFFIKVGGMFAQEDIQGSYFFNKTNKREKLINSGNSDIDIIKQLSKLMKIDMDIPKIDEINTNISVKVRKFSEKQIDLIDPRIEKNRIRLITLSNENYLNSQTEMLQHDSIFISRELSLKLNIKNGEFVIIKGKIDKCRVKCFVSEKVDGFNAFAYKNRSECFNKLTQSKPTDAIYALAYYDLFVEIVK